MGVTFQVALSTISFLHSSEKDVVSIPNATGLLKILKPQTKTLLLNCLQNRHQKMGGTIFLVLIMLNILREAYFWVSEN